MNTRTTASAIPFRWVFGNCGTATACCFQYLTSRFCGGRAWKRQPEKIAALSHGGVRGNPCLFPARFFPELLALTEDHGGSSVIRRHQEDLALLEVDARELYDVDTVQALEELTRKQLAL